MSEDLKVLPLLYVLYEMMAQLEVEKVKDKQVLIEIFRYLMDEYELEHTETTRHFILNTFSEPATDKKSKVDREFAWISEITRLKDICEQNFLKANKWDEPNGCSFDPRKLKNKLIKRILFNNNSDKPHNDAIGDMICTDVPIGPTQSTDH